MPPRIPRKWASSFHPQAVRRGNQLNYRPGWGGSGQQPMPRVPAVRYTGKISGVPLTGGQAQGLISGSGAASLSVGPQGMGTVWYPAQVTLSTSTGALDVSTALVYLGAQGVPITLVGTVFTGNGTVALAIPNMTPGQQLIVQWSGGHSGDTAAFNMIGTMDALTTGTSRG